MKRTTFGLVLALAATPAVADPFTDLLAANGGELCYQGAFHGPDRKVREAVLSFHPEELWGREATVMRLMLRRDDGVWYVFGGCGWADKDVNRGVNGRVLQPEYPLDHGIGCHASAGADEEGGDFPIELRDPETLVVYPGEGLAARSGFQDDLRSEFAELSGPDLILPVTKTDPAACRELVENLGEPIGFPPE